jgi:hypothetical protein
MLPELISNPDRQYKETNHPEAKTEIQTVQPVVMGSGSDESLEPSRQTDDRSKSLRFDHHAFQEYHRATRCIPSQERSPLSMFGRDNCVLSLDNDDSNLCRGPPKSIRC